MLPKTEKTHFVLNLLLIRLILAFFVLQMVLSSALHAGERNLVQNGGFESGLSASIASSWEDNSRWADVDVKYSRSMEGPVRGFVQTIECTRFVRGAVQFVQSGIDLRAGRTYHISLWMKGKMTVPVEVMLRKHGAPYTKYASKAYKVTGEWRRYTFIAPVSVSDLSSRLMIRFTSKGVLSIDDVVVREVSVADAVEQRGVGNLLSNGSFELGVERWGVQIRESEPEHEMPIRMNAAEPNISELRAIHGRYSLLVRTDKNARFLVTSPNTKLVPGAKYTLSFWGYSDRARLLSFGLQSGYYGQVTGARTNVRVGPKWRRYTQTVTAALSEGNLHYVSIGGIGEGSVWIDSIQLERGDISPFKIRRNAEIGFPDRRIKPIYFAGEDVALLLRVFSKEGIRGCKIRVSSIDYFANEAVLYDGSCGPMQEGVRDIYINHPSHRTGYYKLVAKVFVSGSLMDYAEKAIGIVPIVSADNKIESPFGGHIRFSAEGIAIAKKLGTNWVRLNPPRGTKWFVAEKRQGKYRFFNDELKAAKLAGLNILGSLDTSPRWASNAPNDDWRFWAYAPHDMEAWENYVYRTVKHYKGIIDHWEVWNEPNSDGFLKVDSTLWLSGKPKVYVELLERAYKAAKKANPGAVIVGGCATGDQPSQWLGQIIELGALDYLDIISFHFYTDGRPGDLLDNPTVHEIREIRRLMQQYAGRTVPIWETESGILYPQTAYSQLNEISPSYAVNAKEMVLYLVRNYVHLLSSGVDKWFYYNMFSSGRIDRREGNGLFEWDGTPRPTAVAYAVISSMLGDARYEISYKMDNGATVAEFVAKDRRILVVLAAPSAEPHKFSLPLKFDKPYNISVFDLMGGVEAREMDTMHIRLTNVDTAAYIVLE